MTHYNLTLFGVPGVIPKMARAEWLPFADNQPFDQNLYFDGLELGFDVIYMKRETASQVPCSIFVSKASESVPPIYGFVNENVAKALGNGGICVLGAWTTIDCFDHDNKRTGSMEIRQPFTTGFDSTHTERYHFQISLG